MTDAENDGLVEQLSAAALVGYQHLVQRYVDTCLEPATLSCEAASTWIQTGLALTPFAFAETRYSVDWAIAWALLGEWTNHHLFPPPASGEWPRFARIGGLEEGFRHRQLGTLFGDLGTSMFRTRSTTIPLGPAWCGGSAFPHWRQNVSGHTCCGWLPTSMRSSWIWRC